MTLITIQHSFKERFFSIALFATAFFRPFSLTIDTVGMPLFVAGGRTAF
jgi:hypothetical protein